jgi:hypothetical protein
MDGGNVSVLDRILQAHRDERAAAARAYVLAVQRSLTAGECPTEVEHDDLCLGVTVSKLIEQAGGVDGEEVLA